MEPSLSREELEAAHCWEADDRVPQRPEMTDFRRRLRFHQSQWREANGHPIGTQPIRPKLGSRARLVGSRLPLEYAHETGASFVTANALDAVNARLTAKEPHQTFDRQRLWADLLWSPSMAFNLFGDLADDLGLADRAVHTWWPDAPGRVCDVRFAHSPARFDLDYTGNLVAFDVAFLLDVGDGTQGVVGIDTKYHDWAKPETPKPIRMRRYQEITERSDAFASGTIDALNGTNLTMTWLGHLLALSMLQHPSESWSWGRYTVVHVEGNVDFAAASMQYRDLLVDQSTFSSLTLEALLDADALPAATAEALRARYLYGS